MTLQRLGERKTKTAKALRKPSIPSIGVYVLIVGLTVIIPPAITVADIVVSDGDIVNFIAKSLTKDAGTESIFRFQNSSTRSMVNGYRLTP